MTNGRGGSAPLPAASSETDALRSGDALALADAKARLRRAAKSRRAALSTHRRGMAGHAIAERALAVLDLPAGAVVAGYVPMADEADPMPLLAALAGRGHPIALPAVIERGKPLVFRGWAPGEDLVAGWFGIPCPAEAAPLRRPDILLVPLVAFDRRGRRLGHGAGFYDRTLSALRRDGPAIAVGVAFACQEAPEVPAERHDEPLDWIVTERDAMSCDMTCEKPISCSAEGR